MKVWFQNRRNKWKRKMAYKVEYAKFNNVPPNYERHGGLPNPLILPNYNSFFKNNVTEMLSPSHYNGYQYHPSHHQTNGHHSQNNGHHPQNNSHHPQNNNQQQNNNHQSSNDQSNGHHVNLTAFHPQYSTAIQNYNDHRHISHVHYNDQQYQTDSQYTQIHSHHEINGQYVEHQESKTEQTDHYEHQQQEAQDYEELKLPSDHEETSNEEKTSNEEETPDQPDDKSKDGSDTSVGLSDCCYGDTRLLQLPYQGEYSRY